MNEIFISYAREDRPKAQILAHALAAKGWSVWWDPRIPPGKSFVQVITEALDAAKCVIVLWSSCSVTSDWVITEATEAKERGILVPALIEDVRVPLPFKFLQSARLVDWDGKSPHAEFEQLLDAVRQKLGLGLPGEKAKPASIGRRSVISRETRLPILDLIGPTYILDSTYHFLDWNPTFDEIVAKPLRLNRGCHASDFISRLKNCRQVVERSKNVFAPRREPLVDMEVLEYESEKYGVIKFEKIAAQVSNEEGSTMAWSVNLSILEAEKIEQLWRDMQERMRFELNWSRYAVSYDKILLNFDDYHKLVDLVVRKVGDSQRCIDLGAGTGNGTIKLLETCLTREVWSVESNETMLEYLRAKVAERDEEALETGAEEDTNYSGRLTVVKGDILRLEDFPEDYFDAAIMINVLYSVTDPARCMEQIYRILKPGGILALSTPHRDTDVAKLFAGIRVTLEQKGKFQELKSNYEDARLRHTQMDRLIHRDTVDDIRRCIESSGFKIDEWHDKEYVDAVVVIKAVKTGIYA